MYDPSESVARATMLFFDKPGLPSPTREEVERKASEMAQVLEYEGLLDPVVKSVLEKITTRISLKPILTNNDSSHNKNWVHEWLHEGGIYMKAYTNFMMNSKGWSKDIVNPLRDVSFTILSQLEDPRRAGRWDRRGLVIGQVQSGKTANYIGLIACAADAGYKFIIVIAGVHNVLRSQTQRRIDEGFVGRDSTTKELIGVGNTEEYPHPVTLTTTEDDFNKATAQKSGFKLDNFNKPVILVIKKNVNTLKSLCRWLKTMNTQGEDQIAGAPMLMIDDEADYASINTNRDQTDPTKTNKLLRQLLRLFAKSSYVGYTATPFANIFIDPEAYTDKVQEDLFPRHFIYCLNTSPVYFGPEKLFLEKDSDNPCLVSIMDAESYLPLTHKIDIKVSELPPSLYKAVNQFVVVRAIRNLRGHRAQHCSMMINISRFVLVQEQVYDHVNKYIRDLSNAVQVYYALPDHLAPKNSYMTSLKHAYDSEYAGCGYTWDEVKVELQSAMSKIRMYMINSSKFGNVLDYERYDKEGLTAIIVGGFSLSRGLTIEGLCVSYVYRNTRMYDTLMQMGRWFGYRPGYEELCRIHLSEDAIGWYAHISEATKELIDQVDYMRKKGKTPKDFGLYVKTHPDRLLVTSHSKKWHTTTIEMNYSGRLVEFYMLPLDLSVAQANEDLIAKFWEGGRNGVLEKTGKGWIVRDVKADIVNKFLEEFKVHKRLEHRKKAVGDYLRKVSGQYKNCDVLLISLKVNGESISPLLRLRAQKRGLGNYNKKESIWIISRHRVASLGDEGLGLSERQKSEAKKLAGSKRIADHFYRRVRKKPLLMIHVITGKDDTPVCDMRIPTIGMSFPPGEYDTKVNVLVNKVILQYELFGQDDE